jgi:hypothetical protein
VEGQLSRLGRVSPPAAEVLQAARDALWSAVAAEMLATGPDEGRRAPAGQDATRSREREA